MPNITSVAGGNCCRHNRIPSKTVDIFLNKGLRVRIYRLHIDATSHCHQRACQMPVTIASVDLTPAQKGFVADNSAWIKKTAERRGWCVCTDKDGSYVLTCSG
jgi:hypothetical protein